MKKIQEKFKQRNQVFVQRTFKNSDSIQMPSNVHYPKLTSFEWEKIQKIAGYCFFSLAQKFFIQSNTSPFGRKTVTPHSWITTVFCKINEYCSEAFCPFNLGLWPEVMEELTLKKCHKEYFPLFKRILKKAFEGETFDGHLVEFSFQEVLKTFVKIQCYKHFEKMELLLEKRKKQNIMSNKNKKQIQFSRTRKILVLKNLIPIQRNVMGDFGISSKFRIRNKNF